jgi:hypothetical protein
MLLKPILTNGAVNSPLAEGENPRLQHLTWQVFLAEDGKLEKLYSDKRKNLYSLKYRAAGSCVECSVKKDDMAAYPSRLDDPPSSLKRRPSW